MGEKNVIAMMGEAFITIGVVSILWVVVGYSLAFGADHGGVIDGLGHVMLRGVGASPGPWNSHVPGLLFMGYQAMFAVITPALIAGAFTSRMHFRGYLAFIALWSLLIYCPFAHWVWGGGFLGASGLGAADFAGGAVVHESAGAGALAAVLYFGRRREVDRPHDLPLVLLGQLGASAGMVVWMVVDWIRRKKPSGVGLATGAVAGLAAITPAAGYVPVWASLVIGAAAGVACYEAVQLKYRVRYDDALDVVGVHMVAGVIGVLLTGAFASLTVNAAGVDRRLAQLDRQADLVAVGFAFPSVMTIVILWLVDRLVGPRVDPGEQATGLDVTEYGEIGYMLDVFAGSPSELGVDGFGLARNARREASRKCSRDDRLVRAPETVTPLGHLSTPESGPSRGTVDA